jgi:hypothetical protein
VKSIFQWTTYDTNTLNDIWQLAKRTYFSFQVVGKPSYHSQDKEDVHWFASKDRVFLYGNFQLDILSILLELVPQLATDNLSFHGAPSRLGHLLINLHQSLLPILLKETKTIYLEDHAVPTQYQMYTYDALQCFPPETVQVFQYTREWLTNQIQSLAGREWGFKKPPTLTPNFDNKPLMLDTITTNNTRPKSNTISLVE